jgi:hypothetical protein
MAEQDDVVDVRITGGGLRIHVSVEEAKHILFGLKKLLEPESITLSVGNGAWTAMDSTSGTWVAEIERRRNKEQTAIRPMRRPVKNKTASTKAKGGA